MSVESTREDDAAASPIAILVRDAIHRLGLESTVAVAGDDSTWTVTVTGKMDSADIKIISTGADVRGACEKANARVKEVAGW